MNYVLAEQITKTYADKTLFQDISFGINQGQKIALIAANGAGKTTLIRMIMGEEKPEEGSIFIHKDITVGYLAQEPVFQKGIRVFDALYHGNHPVLNAVRKYEEALLDHKGDLEDAMQEMERLQAWDYDTRVKQVLGKLDIHNLDQKVDALSGGQKKRVALAQLLITEPDFLILDEPTNHLDLQMIEWLEQYLDKSRLTLLLVTHDRYFMENITDEILELEGGNLYKYKGSYSYYLEKKAERDFVRQQEIGKAKNTMRTELEWMRRMPKARGTKSKARIDAFYNLQEKAQQKVGQQQVQMTMGSQRLGTKILELHNVSKSFGDQVILDKFTYKFRRKERIGIIGPNGTGKSTFVNMITDREPIDSGKIVTGETIEYGYYTQQGMKINEEKRVIEVITDIADQIQLGNNQWISASQFLQHFRFPPKQQYHFVRKLSGGERRRLYLMTVLAKQPNFLILDEPTNDLDIMTLQVLEEFLLEFGGCLIVVSHDRFFMDKLVDHLFIFEGNGKIRDFPGNYSQYREQLELEEQEKREASAVASSNQVAQPDVEKSAETQVKPKKKVSYKEQKEYEDLEKKIASLEQEKEDLSARLSTGTLDHEELMQISQRLEQVVHEVEEKTMRWMELAEKMEG